MYKPVDVMSSTGLWSLYLSNLSVTILFLGNQISEVTIRSNKEIKDTKHSFNSDLSILQ